MVGVAAVGLAAVRGQERRFQPRHPGGGWWYRQGEGSACPPLRLSALPPLMTAVRLLFAFEEMQ